MLDKTTKIYYWTVIERILFTPISDKDKKRWFKQYHKFALKLWEKEPEFPNRSDYEFLLNERFKISFSTPFNLPKFSINIDYANAKQCFHYDNDFFSELDLTNIFAREVLSQSELRRIRNVKLDRNDIEDILHNMIAHPAHHFHYEDISHYVRLGFNTRNPFLFLYHFAFQLCDYKTDIRNSDKKQDEFARIVDIVEKNIANQDKVPSGELFGL